MRFNLALLALPATIMAAALPSESCPGCATEIDPASSKVQDLVPEVSDRFNIEVYGEHYYCLKDVLKASTQVVSGELINLTVIFEKSESKKGDETHDCSTCTGQKKQCDVAVWIKLDDTHQVNIETCFDL